jgi:hypothetical protein
MKSTGDSAGSNFFGKPNKEDKIALIYAKDFHCFFAALIYHLHIRDK